MFPELFKNRISNTIAALKNEQLSQYVFKKKIITHNYNNFLKLIGTINQASSGIVLKRMQD